MKLMDVLNYTEEFTIPLSTINTTVDFFFKVIHLEIFHLGKEILKSLV